MQKLVGAKEITVYTSLGDTKVQNALGQVYYYQGSLTAPNCTETYQWVVSADVQTADADQIKVFTEAFKSQKNVDSKTGNNRKVQELGDRTVYSYGVSSGKMFGLVALVLALIL